METGKCHTKNGNGCYHLWAVSSSGNGMFRRERCFATRAAANNAKQRTGYGE